MKKFIENVKNGKEYSKGEIFMLSHNFIKNCDIKTYGIDNHCDLLAKDITVTNSSVDFKVKIGGRLNGAEIARAESYKDGSIPLHTLKADIDSPDDIDSQYLYTYKIDVLIIPFEELLLLHP